MLIDALRRWAVLCIGKKFVLHKSLKQEDELYSRHYRSGHPSPPFQDLAPIEESLIGGLKRSLFLHKPPAVPPKEARLPSSSSPSPSATYTPAQLVNMSAVDRSKALRAARMDPHLQVRAMLPPISYHYQLFICSVHVRSVAQVCASCTLL